MNHNAIRTLAIDEAFDQMRKYPCEGDAPQHMISWPRNVVAPAQSCVRPEEYSRAEQHFFVREPCHHLKHSRYCGRDCAGTGLAKGQVRTGGRQRNDTAMGHASRPEHSGGNQKSVFQLPVRSLVPARQTTHISRCGLRARPTIALKLTKRISLRRASLGRAMRLVPTLLRASMAVRGNPREVVVGDGATTWIENSIRALTLPLSERLPQ